MNAIPWNVASAVFIGTLPILGAIVWNLIKLDRIEKRVDRWEHPIVKP